MHQAPFEALYICPFAVESVAIPRAGYYYCPLLQIRRWIWANQNGALACLLPMESPAPSSARLVAGTQCTSVHCMNGKWVLRPLLAQLHSHCVLSVVGVNGSLLDHILHNSRRHLSHCVCSTVNVNRSPVPWQPWWPRPKSAGKSEDLLCASKLLSTPFLWGTKKKSGKAWHQNPRRLTGEPQVKK